MTRQVLSEGCSGSSGACRKKAGEKGQGSTLRRRGRDARNALTGAALGLSKRNGRYRAGERMAFRLPNGAEWLAFFLALIKAGPRRPCRSTAGAGEGCLEIGPAKEWRERASISSGEFHTTGESGGLASP